MRVAVIAVLAILPGCRQVFGIDDTTGPAADAPAGVTDGGPVDARPGDPDAAWVTDVAHLSPIRESQLAHDLDVVITDAVTINTTTGVITPALNGITLLRFEQDAIGPEVYVLDARQLTVLAPVTITGALPLIVVADQIDISAAIDASATGVGPGPGGGGPNAGPAPGSNGMFQGSDDAGGGGGGFGSTGGAGGTAGTTPGGAGGAVAGDATLSALIGGSGGGGSARCPNLIKGGAGGGALQLTARGRLTITSTITVSGGGGTGGDTCGGSHAGGAGGGSGGALYLQARRIEVEGLVSANGGGGGGGSTASGGVGTPGEDGGTGFIPAQGGAGGGTTGWHGGTGAAADQPAGAAPGFPSVANTGGGGGGGGRIVARAAQVTAINASPPAVSIGP